MLGVVGTMLRPFARELVCDYFKAQNMTGIRAQRNGIWDHKAFEPKSGIRFITRPKNLFSQYFFRIIRFVSIEFPVKVHYLLLPAGGSSCHTKSWSFDENMVSYS